MKMYILENNKPVEAADEKQFFDWMSKNKGIAKEISGVSTISTVFLGFDHGGLYNISTSGKPVLFETMIFGGEHNGYQKRYLEYDEAIKGHNDAVELVNKMQINREMRLDELGI